jgi:hypothetical protein
MNHPNPVQFLRKSPKKKGLGGMKEEMVSFKHLHLKGNARLSSPSYETSAADSAIPQTTKCADGDGKRKFTGVNIGFVDSEICPEGR